MKIDFLSVGGRAWEGILSSGDTKFSLLIPRTGQSDRPLLFSDTETFRQLNDASLLMVEIKLKLFDCEQ